MWRNCRTLPNAAEHEKAGLIKVEWIIRLYFCILSNHLMKSRGNIRWNAYVVLTSWLRPPSYCMREWISHAASAIYITICSFRVRFSMIGGWLIELEIGIAYYYLYEYDEAIRYGSMIMWLTISHYLLFQQRHRNDPEIVRDVEYNVFDAFCQIFDQQTTEEGRKECIDMFAKLYPDSLYKLNERTTQQALFSVDEMEQFFRGKLFTIHSICDAIKRLQNGDHSPLIRMEDKDNNWKSIWIVYLYILFQKFQNIQIYELTNQQTSKPRITHINHFSCSGR